MNVKILDNTVLSACQRWSLHFQVQWFQQLMSESDVKLIDMDAVSIKRQACPVTYVFRQLMEKEQIVVM